MKRLMRFKWAILVLVVHALLAGWFACTLPGDVKIPIHWNAAGEIDGYTSKTNGLLFLLGINILLFLMIYLMPYYSPWYKNREEQFERFLPSMTNILVLFFCLLSLISLYLARMGNLALPFNYILFVIGLMLIFLGNLLPKAPRNFFIGIRTPWTLANEEIWNRTHRLGAWAFVCSGLMLMAKSFIYITQKGFQNITSIIAFAILLYPVLYSFLLYQKLKRAGKEM